MDWSLYWNLCQNPTLSIMHYFILKGRYPCFLWLFKEFLPLLKKRIQFQGNMYQNVISDLNIHPTQITSWNTSELGKEKLYKSLGKRRISSLLEFITGEQTTWNITEWYPAPPLWTMCTSTKRLRFTGEYWMVLVS